MVCLFVYFLLTIGNLSVLSVICYSFVGAICLKQLKVRSLAASQREHLKFLNLFSHFLFELCRIRALNYRNSQSLLLRKNKIKNVELENPPCF